MEVIRRKFGDIVLLNGGFKAPLHTLEPKFSWILGCVK